MTEHTPGPWKIDEAENLPLAIIQDNEDGIGICEIEFPGSTEAYANAYLIAAAPELLKALEMAVRFMQDEDLDEALSGEFEIFTDAIAKARRESCTQPIAD